LLWKITILNRARFTIKKYILIKEYLQIIQKRCYKITVFCNSNNIKTAEVMNKTNLLISKKFNFLLLVLKNKKVKIDNNNQKILKFSILTT